MSLPQERGLRPPSTTTPRGRKRASRTGTSLVSGGVVAATVGWLHGKMYTDVYTFQPNRRIDAILPSPFSQTTAAAASPLLQDQCCRSGVRSTSNAKFWKRLVWSSGLRPDPHELCAKGMNSHFSKGHRSHRRRGLNTIL